MCIIELFHRCKDLKHLILYEMYNVCGELSSAALPEAVYTYLYSFCFSRLRIGLYPDELTGGTHQPLHCGTRCGTHQPLPCGTHQSLHGGTWCGTHQSLHYCGARIH